MYPVDTSAPLSARSVYTPIIEVLLGNCEVAAFSEDVGFEVPCVPVEVLPVEIVIMLVEVLVEEVVEEDVEEHLIELVDALVDSVGVLSVVLEVVPGGELVWLVVEALLEDWVDAVPTELEIVLAVVDPCRLRRSCGRRSACWSFGELIGAQKPGATQNRYRGPTQRQNKDDDLGRQCDSWGPARGMHRAFPRNRGRSIKEQP